LKLHLARREELAPIGIVASPTYVPIPDVIPSPLGDVYRAVRGVNESERATIACLHIVRVKADDSEFSVDLPTLPAPVIQLVVAMTTVWPRRTPEDSQLGTT
jgi:hypothetical protein